MTREEPMTADSVSVADYRGPGEVAGKRPRMWVPVAVMVLYWAYFIISTWVVEMSMFVRFMSQSLILVVMGLVFLIWWGFNRRVKLGDKLWVLAAAIGSPFLAVVLAHRTIGGMVIFLILPLIFTVWTLWLLVARKASQPVWKWGLIGMMFVPSVVYSFFRMEGLAGRGMPDLRFRWSETAEERYLSQRGKPTTEPATRPVAVVLRAGDWPGFRGGNRDAVVRGVTINTDWQKNPPKQIWKRPIGPGWSSMT